MRGLLFWGCLAVAAGACYHICKAIDELDLYSSNVETDTSGNFSDRNKVDYNAYNAVISKDWIMNKTKETFKDLSTKKVVIFDLEFIDSFDGKFQKNFSDYADDGYDYVIAFMDSSDKIHKIEVVKSLFDNTEEEKEVKQFLGTGHMLVINS